MRKNIITIERAIQRVEAAETEVRRLQGRNAWLEEHYKTVLEAGPSTALADTILRRAEAAEAEVKRLREELEGIAACHVTDSATACMVGMANRALAPVEKKP
jgi:phage shock protein A